MRQTIHHAPERLLAFAAQLLPLGWEVRIHVYHGGWRVALEDEHCRHVPTPLAKGVPLVVALVDAVNAARRAVRLTPVSYPEAIE